MIKCLQYIELFKTLFPQYGHCFILSLKVSFGKFLIDDKIFKTW